MAPAVIDAMSAVLGNLYGNPSSVHGYGQEAKTAIDIARSGIAKLLGAEPTEITFTSGGSESINLAIRGTAAALTSSGRRHLVASAIEHEAVHQTLKALSKQGWSTTLVPVDKTGIVEPSRLAEALTEETGLVSIMHANNEIGTIQPIPELVELAHSKGAIFHTDAVQSVGKIPVNVQDLGVDLLSISGHKFNGPKGTGALWIKRGSQLQSQITGGRQERNRRAGTENVPAIIGLGAAAKLVLETGQTTRTAIVALRDRLETGILREVSGTQRNGDQNRRVGNTSSISFQGIEAEALLIALDLQNIAVSTGSACSSGSLEPSHVLRAMGFGHHRTQNSIRFSLGLGTNVDEVDRVVALLPGLVEQLRSTSNHTMPPETGRRE
ncbi:MAG: cysteine desulfurase NifS [Acidobacteria bacterium]|nr:cysteine desulfurase NifS [Acidobacteriota bacterium]|tara:strand:+ start:1153 stop:2298 length:1146 start_codon:yes stop_codon:yes gene_type:complete